MKPRQDDSVTTNQWWESDDGIILSQNKEEIMKYEKMLEQNTHSYSFLGTVTAPKLSGIQNGVIFWDFYRVQLEDGYKALLSNQLTKHECIAGGEPITFTAKAELNKLYTKSVSVEGAPCLYWAVANTSDGKYFRIVPAVDLLELVRTEYKTAERAVEVTKSALHGIKEMLCNVNYDVFFGE